MKINLPRRSFMLALLAILAAGFAGARYLRIESAGDVYEYVGMLVHGPAAFRVLAFRQIRTGDSLDDVLRQFPPSHISTVGVFRVVCLHCDSFDVTLIAKGRRLLGASGGHFDWEKVFFDGFTDTDRQEYDQQVLLMHPLQGAAKHHPTSAEMMTCPDGHSTLKDVPIWYGTPDFTDKAAILNMNQDVESYQAWQGGCVQSGDSPTVRVTCVTCGFGYDSDHELWSRRSSEKNSFRRPFSPMLDGFPLPPANMVVGAVTYDQSVKTNAVWMEFVSYTSCEDQPVVLARVTNWLARFNITTPSLEMLGHETLAGTKRNIYNWGHLNPSVMLHQEEDGTSWVMMSNARQ